MIIDNMRIVSSQPDVPDECMADKDLNLVQAEIGVNYSLIIRAFKGSRLSPFVRLGTCQGSDLRDQATMSMQRACQGPCRSSIPTNPCRSNLDLVVSSSAVQLKDS